MTQVKTLTAMVEVLSSAQRSKDVPILTSRFHSFLRAPEGIFLNLHTRRLTPWLWHRSSMKVSKKADCIPVTPMEPTSSLSASMHTAVLRGAPVKSSRAAREA